MSDKETPREIMREVKLAGCSLEKRTNGLARRAFPVKTIS